MWQAHFRSPEQSHWQRRVIEEVDVITARVFLNESWGKAWTFSFTLCCPEAKTQTSTNFLCMGSGSVLCLGFETDFDVSTIGLMLLDYQLVTELKVTPGHLMWKACFAANYVSITYKYRTSWQSLDSAMVGRGSGFLVITAPHGLRG